MARVAVGDRAPEFELHSQDGTVVRLRDLLARGPLVLYFYPKDNTPGCTAEAGAFRDSYARFAEIGAEVVGVSSDSVDSHRGFASQCNIPFKILSDPGGAVRKLYGVPSSLGLLPGRVTYVVDMGGVVRSIFSSQIQATKHVEEALKGLGSIPTGAGRETGS